MKLWFAAVLVVSSLGWPSHAKSTTDQAHEVLVVAQQKWIDALEQCESRGIATAVNPKDRDGTPSYGAFQFKTQTFVVLVKKYGIATSSLGYMDRAAQREIVERMINDASFTDKELSSRQFPDCIQNHVGLPPRK